MVFFFKDRRVLALFFFIILVLVMSKNIPYQSGQLQVMQG